MPQAEEPFIGNTHMYALDFMNGFVPLKKSLFWSMKTDQDIYLANIDLHLLRSI